MKSRTIYIFLGIIILSGFAIGSTLQKNGKDSTLSLSSDLATSCPKNAQIIPGGGKLAVCKRTEHKPFKTEPPIIQAIIYDSTNQIAQDYKSRSIGWYYAATSLASQVPFGIIGYSAKKLEDNFYVLTFTTDDNSGLLDFRKLDVIYSKSELFYNCPKQATALDSSGLARLCYRRNYKTADNQSTVDAIIYDPSEQIIKNQITLKSTLKKNSELHSLFLLQKNFSITPFPGHFYYIKNS